ncbi:tumor necrosis factor receptor superfamily member 6-like isoform X3 [Polyodon spathula]|uniref:tumor necrosis factor receptor superfamily member 6-like isoform X3 n=1 Tax=Polyodon spathula TaxID=7913 RepID=UPI001B7F6822|nr:tumor necrosis factor receptor superfamily member 6-like isoform X3 [Polyodon spathula]
MNRIPNTQSITTRLYWTESASFRSAVTGSEQNTPPLRQPPSALYITRLDREDPGEKSCVLCVSRSLEVVLRSDKYLEYNTMNTVLGLTLFVLTALSLCSPMNSDKTDRLDNDASLNEEKNRTAREIICPGGQYPHSGFCCVNCPAGTYVKEKCTTAGSSGQCAACTFGTDYTEHGSGLERCLQCTRCRSDQEEAVPCTQTQNRVCRCKSGTHYCPPEEPCEVCKRCSKCPEGTVVRNCNATANAVCAPRDSPPAGTESASSSSNITLAVVLALAVAVAVAVIGWILWKKQRCGLISERPSEQSVNILIPTLNDTSELYSLTPLQDNALLACLDEFCKVPFKSRNRLMRKVGLHDNKIETAKQNHPHDVEEQFHEMLLSWHEEQGEAADINTLLRALLHLDHRLSVEEITAEVIKNKFYTKSSSHLL